jgi:alpha/beta hydrolase family protein
MKPTRSGYADVNGIRLYHEIYGEGEPLVLIHGGLTTIDQMQGWVQPLAETRQVIAVEMQGHGRTADTDRPMTLATMGDDIAALLDVLAVPKADLVGHSFGVAIRTTADAGPIDVCGQRLDTATAHCRILRAFRRRSEGTRLGECEIVEIAARDRPRLQPLQLPNIRGSAADC